MAYGVVPIKKFPLLEQYYNVLSQIFNIDENENPYRVPFVCLEDDFNTVQLAEIAEQGGQVFEDANAYNLWKDSQ